jgi:lipopolysaccharide export system protein LptA
MKKYFIFFLAFLYVAPVFAQETNTSTGQPVEIEADQALEWHREDKTYVARGNASAKQGNVTLLADTLTAHYKNNNDIYQVLANGNVRIESSGGTAYGEQGTYDVDNAKAILTGQGLKLVMPQETVTARDSLEYWQNEKMGLARGNAIAVKEDKRIKADVIKAYFAEKAGSNDLEMDHMEAEGNVVITTPTDVVTGTRATYKRTTQIATVEGGVKITRDQNQLNGDRAEVDMKTGISKVFAGPAAGGKTGRVRALFYPKGNSGKEKK